MLMLSLTYNFHLWLAGMLFGSWDHLQLCAHIATSGGIWFIMQKKQRVSLMLHRMRECTRSLIHSGDTASQFSTRMMISTGTGSTKEPDVVSPPGGVFGTALRQLRYVLTLKFKAFKLIVQFLRPPCLMIILILIYLCVYSPLLPIVDYMLCSSKL